MRITGVHIVGLRSFIDTGRLDFSQKINIFTGKNNSGKSTILKSIINTQIPQFSMDDIRPESKSTYISIFIDSPSYTDENGNIAYYHSSTRSEIYYNIRDAGKDPSAYILNSTLGHTVFPSVRPNNPIVPFFSTRRSVEPNQVIKLGTQATVTGMFVDLYARIDTLSSTAHPMNRKYSQAVNDITGASITTTLSNDGKIAGYYFNERKFVHLNAMGDGVTEMVGLIAELCLERDKIFVVEEPETHLHPAGLRALLDMIRDASKYNQFFIATHSGIVIQELGSEQESKVFRVYKDGSEANSPSRIDCIGSDASDRISILNELGYTFSDFELHEAWLFLEESSAEVIINKILIPFFVPHLQRKLRTFSSRGVNRIDTTVEDFMRLVTFVHLQPAYKDKIWIAMDGDAAGKIAYDKVQNIFQKINIENIKMFAEHMFENYYPEQFVDEIDTIKNATDKKEKRRLKADLLEEVLMWTAENEEQAKSEWAKSAKEVIEFLESIQLQK